MTVEHPHGEPAARPADAARPAADGEVDALLDAVERDVAAGMPIRDAMRERLGLVFPGPLPEAERVPVDGDLVRAYIAGSLPTGERERVCGLIWGDDRWGVAYLRMSLENAPGSRPELLDRLFPEENPEPVDGSLE
jgi:hypothetical protein